MKNKICILGKQSRQDFDELQIQHLSVTLHGLTLANFSQMHGPCQRFIGQLLIISV